MLIYSQDGSSVVNMRCVAKLFVDKQNNVIAVNNSDGFKNVLGTFTSNDEATKCIKNIVNAYTNNAAIFFIPQNKDCKTIINPKYAGKTVSKGVLHYISDHFELYYHSICRMKDRGFLKDVPDFDNATIKKVVKQVIYNPYLAFYNTDGTINICIDENHYFVFAYNPDEKNYTCITYKESSKNGYTVNDKILLAKKGVIRKTS